MTMYDIEHLFTKTDDNGFPINDCTIRTKEHNICEGANYYICLIIDVDFVGCFKIARLRPYTYLDDESGDLLYGWVDDSGNILDNMYKSIHIDKRCVIGCAHDSNDEATLKSEWKKYKNILDSQWE